MHHLDVVGPHELIYLLSADRAVTLQHFRRSAAVHAKELTLARHEGTVNPVLVAYLAELLVCFLGFEACRRKTRELV